jgi:hypothetical protein
MLIKNTYDYFNPLEMVPYSASTNQAMKICFDALFECDGILLLNDHKFSEGSKLEEAVARYCKKQIFYEDDLI